MDEFLQKMGELFECVLFTASLAKVRFHNLRAEGATLDCLFSVNVPWVDLFDHLCFFSILRRQVKLKEFLL